MIGLRALRKLARYPRTRWKRRARARARRDLKAARLLERATRHDAKLARLAERQDAKVARLAERDANARRREILVQLRDAAGSGDEEHVLAAIASASEPDGYDPELLVGKALALEKVRRFAEAHELLVGVIERDGSQANVWARAGFLLPKLKRQHEIPGFIDRMFESLSATPETLLSAAEVARKGGHHALACRLAEDALASPGAAPVTIVGAAQLLLDLGEEGRVITMLERAPTFEDEVLRDEAAELQARSKSRLRLASGPAGNASWGPTDRADTLAVEAILSGVGDARSSRCEGIAIVVSSLGPGGAQTQLVHILRGLCSRKSRVGRVTLLITAGTPSDSEFRAADIADLDITVERMSSFFGATGEVITGEDAERLSVLHPRTVERTAFLVDRLRVHRPEAVLSMSYSYLDAVLAASLAGVPRIVVSARGGVPGAGTGADRLLTAAYGAALVRANVSLVTNSHATANAFHVRLGRSAGEISAVLNGVDVDELQARLDPDATERYRSMLEIPTSARVVGSVLRHRNVKRPDLWMRAAGLVAARLHDVVFVLVGPGFQPDQLEAAGVPGEFVERFRMPGVQRDVPGWMGMMDVVLLTSASEGTPNVLLEAQALGKPVVTSAVGGTGETFLPGRTGILLSANPTPEEIAEAVIEVLEDPGYATRARESGPELVRRRFGIARMVDELVAVCFPAGTA